MNISNNLSKDDINTLVDIKWNGKVTKKSMIEALIKHANILDNLRLLLETYPEEFIACSMYLPNPLKIKMEKIIQEKVKDISLPISEKARKRESIIDSLPKQNELSLEDTIRRQVEMLNKKKQQHL